MKIYFFCMRKFLHVLFWLKPKYPTPVSRISENGFWQIEICFSHHVNWPKTKIILFVLFQKVPCTNDAAHSTPQCCLFGIAIFVMYISLKNLFIFKFATQKDQYKAMTIPLMHDLFLTLELRSPMILVRSSMRWKA